MKRIAPIARTWAKLLPVLLSLACVSGKQALIVSGHSLYAAGEQFSNTSEAMKTLCKADAIPRQTCEGWAVFQARFKLAYNLAVEGWDAGSELDAQVWAQLGKELAQFSAAAIKAKAKEGGI